MEAYMKAFEKLERTQQRKQEQKSAKSSPKKPRVMQKSSLVNAQKRKMISQKRKKRKSKTLHHNTTTSTRKLSSHSVDKHSGESDVATSSEETVMRPSTSSSSTTCNPYNNSSYKLSQAEFLLSYSQFKNEPETNLSGIPPLISPACILIENAIGNLEQSTDQSNEFKFPKTKPKKTIMNEWFHDRGDGIKQEEPEYKVNFKPDMSIVAKVEEFLDRNNVKYDHDEPLSLVKNDYKPLTTPPQASSPQIEGTNFGSETSVKKRWLRQAISEETADENSSTQAEFTTPLKKRRVFIEPEGSSTASQESCTKIKVKDDPEVEYQAPDSVHTTKIKVEEDTTVSSTVEENASSSNLLNLSDVQVSDAQPNTEPENAIVAEIMNEEASVAPNAPNTIPNNEQTNPLEVMDEDNKSSNSEEMAEYQKVIASFHNENIMMLQTRNKKSKSFSSDTSDSDRTKGSVVSRLNFDIEVKNNAAEKASIKREMDDVPDHPVKSYRTRSPSPESTSAIIENAPILAQTLTAAPETRHVTETIPFGSSRYLNNIRSSDEVPSILTTTAPILDEIVNQVASAPAPPLVPLPGGATFSTPTAYGYRPMMTNLTMNEYPDTTGVTGVVAPPPGTYLTSYPKATLITDPKAPIGSTLTGQFATVNSAYVNSYATTASTIDATVAAATAAAVVAAAAQASAATTPSSFLGKSYSTLNDNTSYYGQNIFGQTKKSTSSDPRLNPNLNPPEDVKPSPTPKKKVN